MANRNLAIIAVGLVALTLLLLPLFWPENLLLESLPFFLSLLFLVMMGAVAAYDRATGKFDFLQPLLLLGLLFFFPNFIFKTWHILFTGKDHYLLDRLRNRDYYLSLALVTGVLSYGCMVLGYYFSPFQRQARRLWLGFKSRSWNPSRLKWPSFVLFLSGVVTTFYLLQSGGGVGYTVYMDTGVFTNVIQHISKYNLYGLFIFLWALIVARAYRQPSWTALLAVMVVIQLALGLLLGSRGYLFQNGLVVLAVFHYTGLLRENFRRIIWVTCFIAFLLVVGMIFVTPFREAKLKTIGVNRPASLGESAGMYRDIIHDRTKESGGQGLDNFLEILAGRTNNLEALALVLERAGQVKHLERSYGIDNNMFDDLLWGLVPRFLYPDKPNLCDISVIHGIIYHDGPIQGVQSMANGTIMGDLYRNLGYAGILVGMLILGMFLRLMYVVLVEHNHNPLFFAVYFFSMLFINLESYYFPLYYSLIRLWIMMALFGGILLFFHNRGGLPSPRLSRKKRNFTHPVSRPLFRQ